MLIIVEIPDEDWDWFNSALEEREDLRAYKEYFAGVTDCDALLTFNEFVKERRERR